MRFIRRCTTCGARIVIAPPHECGTLHPDGKTMTYVVLDFLDPPSGTCCTYDGGGYASRYRPPFNERALPSAYC